MQSQIYFNLSSSANESDKPAFLNTHYSVDADGESVVDLHFVEEPLGMPASEKYGWPLFEFGECIGPDSVGEGGRYVLKRKLGWGMSSSTWLALDTL